MPNEPDTHRYDDILSLPHPTSLNHPRMSAGNRAAQFSPFAALTGYEAVIEETGRYTEERAELDDTEKATLNDRLRTILEHIGERPEVTVTYFLPDEHKSGGAYVNHTGAVKKIDEYERTIVFADKTTVPLEDIYAINSELFQAR